MRSALKPEVLKMAPETQKLQTTLCRLAGQAIADYRMVDDGDTVMVCLSGSKDKYTILDILLILQQSVAIEFKLIAMSLEQKRPGIPAHVLQYYLAERGVPFHIETRDTYSIVKRLIPEGKTASSIYSRLRRG